jgi:hypothetical protein
MTINYSHVESHLGSEPLPLRAQSQILSSSWIDQASGLVCFFRVKLKISLL